MFESLKEFSNIIVSGPQRSGTRIAAKIIAHDIDKIYIDEREINFHDFRLLQWYLNKGNSVIQCPGLCHLLHQITNKGTLIIQVRRSISQILSSERRQWSDEARLIELYKYGYSEGIISRIKYDFWDNVQQPILGDRGRNIEYEKLSIHPLFIKDRQNFRWDQTE